MESIVGLFKEEEEEAAEEVRRISSSRGRPLGKGIVATEYDGRRRNDGVCGGPLFKEEQL